MGNSTGKIVKTIVKSSLKNTKGFTRSILNYETDRARKKRQRGNRVKRKYGIKVHKKVRW